MIKVVNILVSMLLTKTYYTYIIIVINISAEPFKICNKLRLKMAKNGRNI